MNKNASLTHLLIIQLKPVIEMKRAGEEEINVSHHAMDFHFPFLDILDLFFGSLTFH